MNAILIKLLSVVVAVAVVAGGAFYEGFHKEEVAFSNYRLQQAVAAAKEEAQAQAAVQAAEASATNKLATVATTYQEQINALNKTRDSLIAAASTVHRVYVRVSSPSPNGVSKAASGTSSRYADSSAALDAGSASFFYGEFTAADALADQLAAAQAVIVQDRLTCGVVK